MSAMFFFLLRDRPRLVVGVERDEGEVAGRDREQALAVAVTGDRLRPQWPSSFGLVWTRSAKIEISSPTLGAPVNLSASAATTTHLPRAWRDARLPAASAIWLISQPPKIPPYGLVSVGMAVTRIRGMRSDKSACSVTMPVEEYAKGQRRA